MQSSGMESELLNFVQSLSPLSVLGAALRIAIILLFSNVYGNQKKTALIVGANLIFILAGERK